MYRKISLIIRFLILLGLVACQSAEMDNSAVATAIQRTVSARSEEAPGAVEVTRVVEVNQEVEVVISRLVEVTRLVEVEVVVTATPLPEPTATETPEVSEITAEQVLNALIDAGLPIGDSIVFTAETDPNELLGRPGQYTGMVNFRDTRLSTEEGGEIDTQDGGSIEVFVDNTGAVNRSEYIQAIAEGLPALAEYNFVQEKVLLRLSKSLTPEQADEYAAVLEALFE